MTDRCLVGLVSAALAVSLGAPPVACARDVVIEVEGCTGGLAAELRSAMALELGPPWRIVLREAPLHVVVRMADCDASQWMLRVTNRRGEVLLGPDALNLGGLQTTTRPRIAALWVAERLPQIPEWAEAEAEVARLTLSVGGAGFVEGDGVLDAMPFFRVGGAVHVLEWLSLGGSVEGGILSEAFGHRQPAIRLCAEPQFTLSLLRDVELGVGPKGCFTTSRHIVGGDDQWVAGASVGALIRVSYRVDAAWDLGLRVDGEAWERDSVVALTAPGLPWMALVGVSLEARLR